MSHENLFTDRMRGGIDKLRAGVSRRGFSMIGYKIKSAVRRTVRGVVITLQLTTAAAALLTIGYLWGANTVLQGKPDGLQQIESLAANVKLPAPVETAQAAPVPAPTEADKTIAFGAREANPSHKLQMPKGK